MENAMIRNRANELLKEMTSFNKEGYQKSELLPEMLKLQNEMVGLTFSDDHASVAGLKLRNVVSHLEQLNSECGNIADEELERLKSKSYNLNNLIKAEISGAKGECRVFKVLERIKSQNRVLKNVELKDGDIRAELDAVVLTSKCATIVEAKNTAKDIFINEKGEYFRTGEYLKKDSNIGEKIETKESLLRKVLDAAGHGRVQIRSIVVFTNDTIEVHNKYRHIKTCFTSQLNYLIDECKYLEVISSEDLDRLQACIAEAECKEAYPFGFDVQEFKEEFANLMAKLEYAKSHTDENIEEDETKRTVLDSRLFKVITRTVAAAAIAVGYLIRKER